MYLEPQKNIKSLSSIAKIFLQTNKFSHKEVNTPRKWTTNTLFLHAMQYDITSTRNVKHAILLQKLVKSKTPYTHLIEVHA